MATPARFDSNRALRMLLLAVASLSATLTVYALETHANTQSASDPATVDDSSALNSNDDSGWYEDRGFQQEGRGPRFGDPSDIPSVGRTRGS